MNNKEQITEEKKPNTEKLNRKRFLFFQELFQRAGIREDLAERISEEVAPDNRFVEHLVDSLVSRGIFQPRGEVYERVTLCNFEGLTLPGDFKNQLERKRLTASSPEEWCRLGHLFACAGDQDRAALCHRTGFGLISQASPEFLVTLSEAIDPARNKSLALGCIDRVAEIILTGDQALDNPDRHDLTSEDPAGCAVLLDRACQAAIRCHEPGRAASLARAATALFERCGLRYKLQHALGSLASALTDLGDLEGALRTIERRRLVLSAESDYLHVASCYEQMAMLSESCGNLDNASRYYELAVQVYESVIDPRNAALAAQAQGSLYLRHGRLDDAVDSYERSIEIGAEISEVVGPGHLGAACSWEAMGNLSTALRCARRSVEAFEELGDSMLLANAKLQHAYFLVQLGMADDSSSMLEESRDSDPPIVEEGLYAHIEALISLNRDCSVEALSHFRTAYNRFKDHGQDDSAARMMLEIGHFLDLTSESKERAWFFKALDSLSDLGPELTLRMSVLRGRMSADGELLQDLFSEAASSEWTHFKLEAAEAFANWAFENGRVSLVTRGVASALRTLAEFINRLDRGDQASFNRTPILQRIASMAEAVRDRLHRAGEGTTIDSDATAKISPAFVIQGLLLAIGRPPSSESIAEVPEQPEASDNIQQDAELQPDNVQEPELGDADSTDSLEQVQEPENAKDAEKTETSD
jgi:tetratricopeptide (TPR) repeat protein